MKNLPFLKSLASLLHGIKSRPTKPSGVIDLELTNACNASCIFCPRHRTPKQGFMTFETYKQVIERAEESGNIGSIHFCGLGEPLLHPRVVDFVSYLSKKGLCPPNITTNAFLLTSDLSRQLLDAGLKEVEVSISGLDGLYEQIHGLDFEVTKNNVLDFMRISEGRCKIWVSITRCGINEAEIERMVAIWNAVGIHRFILFDCINRGGALDRGYYFTESDRFYAEAEEILARNNLPDFCLAPFMSTFIGWDGNYYMCCNDFTKTLPLGTVFEYSIREINAIKESLLVSSCDICKKCDTNTVNIVREILFRIARNETSVSDMEKRIEAYIEAYKELEAFES